MGIQSTRGVCQASTQEAAQWAVLEPVFHEMTFT